MTKQKESFSFDVPLNLEEKWMMGVTSLSKQFQIEAVL